MAGSYRHLHSERGPGSWSIAGENLGDAYETVEELLWLVERAIGRDEALRLIDTELHPMMRGELHPDAAFLLTREVMGR